MACETLYALRTVDNELCNGNIGGIKSVFIALKKDVTATVSAETGGDRVVTVAAAGTTQKPFKEYKFRKNTSSMTSTLNSDTDNMSFYWTTDLLMQFKKTDAAKRMGIMSLVQNEVVAVVKDQNDKVWFLGFDEPLVASAGSQNSGTQRSDGNYYEITLQDESNEAPFTVKEWDSSLVDA